MPDPTLTLVIPTVGRPTLARTLASLARQPWRPGDEVLLVGDGPRPVARELWDQFRLPGRYVETPAVLGSWGHGARNWVAANGLVRTSHRAQLDDDDIWTADALRAVRAAITADPGRPHLFRMAFGHQWPGVPVVWRTPELAEGNVGTPLLVAPVALGHPEWTGRYGGDYDHIRATCERHPAGPVWHRELVCVCRPHLA